MLRVTVEIVPFGEESKKYTVGVAKIVNTGKNKNRPHFGDYDCVFYQDGYEYKSCEVKDHLRTDRFWELIQKALNKD